MNKNNLQEFADKWQQAARSMEIESCRFGISAHQLVISMCQTSRNDPNTSQYDIEKCKAIEASSQIMVLYYQQKLEALEADNNI